MGLVYLASILRVFFSDGFALIMSDSPFGNLDFLN